MSSILHRSLDRTYATVSSGKGSLLRDAQGNEFIDACGGAAVSCLGHANPEVLDAIRAQLGRLEYAHTSFFTTETAEELAELLVSNAPEDLTHAYFVSGGSEAVEAALKLARQYFVEIGQPERRFFIGRRQSYHGNTLGALAVGGNEWRRAQFAPLLMETFHVSPCYDYRDRLEKEDPIAYGARLAAELEDTIQRIGAAHVIAFVAETVGGATQGCTTAPPGYFSAVREICDRHGILLILDEVMCGMGRTGTLHACEQEGVTPDLMTVAKGLGGGYAPIGAVLVGRKIMDALRGGSRLFQHGHTYVGHPLACAAALAVQRIVLRQGMLSHVAEQGARLRKLLETRLGDISCVGDIRGRGLFQAVEFVAERRSKSPYDAGDKFHAQVRREAETCGLLVYAMGGTIDGRRGDHVLLAPPFNVDDATLEAIVERLAGAITSVERTQAARMPRRGDVDATQLGRRISGL